MEPLECAVLRSLGWTEEKSGPDHSIADFLRWHAVLLGEDDERYAKVVAVVEKLRDAHSAAYAESGRYAVRLRTVNRILNNADRSQPQVYVSLPYAYPDFHIKDAYTNRWLQVYDRKTNIRNLAAGPKMFEGLIAVAERDLTLLDEFHRASAYPTIAALEYRETSGRSFRWCAWAGMLDERIDPMHPVLTKMAKLDPSGDLLEDIWNRSQSKSADDFYDGVHRFIVYHDAGMSRDLSFTLLASTEVAEDIADLYRASGDEYFRAVLAL